MAEADEFQNVDADADPGDEESKAAKALWVRVANSTMYTMEVETFTNRAKRQEVQGILKTFGFFKSIFSGFKVRAEIPLLIPGFEMNPAVNVRFLCCSIL